jgi:hypothetical protein
MLVYRLYGHYSFNSRDGGEPVELVLSKGYSVGAWIDGTKMIVKDKLAVSVEQAIHHGFARIVA